MLPKGAQRERILPVLEGITHHGQLTPAALDETRRATGVPAADVHGVASFYTLISGEPRTRVCQGLTCKLAGSDALIRDLEAKGERVEAVSCLGQCDRPPAALDPKLEVLGDRPRGRISPADPELAINLAGADGPGYPALTKIRARSDLEAFLDELTGSGLTGRGGAGFPAGIKMRAVRGQAETERYVVCNADEAEPGTFKDREIMLRRPHLLLEGIAIAAHIVEAQEAFIYIRGEFQAERRSVEAALAEAGDAFEPLTIRCVSGHGAYICGEETALLESMEGKRGMPRLKPPYPTEVGFRGKPTLINNVETLACAPSIVLRGPEWFKALGRTEAGTKLYCLSGHVVHPGVYELPMGVTLDELVAAAGGYVGDPIAFSPGGASSGFLPISKRDVPLDFKHLAEAGSMLGSAGVVVLNDTVDMAMAAVHQAVFFEDESCGQCAPCRIGTRVLRRALNAYLDSGDPAALEPVRDVAWEMEEGSICGLGIAAPLPLTTALTHFPAAFGVREEGA